MKNYFLIYLFILLSYNIIAMNKTETNNYKCSLSYILNNSFIDDIKKHLEDGGDINELNCNGETLLILAIKKNDLEAVKFLLDNNALVFNSSNSGIKNNLDYIKENTNPQIIELVKQKYNQELDALKLNFINFFENITTLNNSSNSVGNLSNTNNNNLNNSNTSNNNLFKNISDLPSTENSSNNKWQCEICNKFFAYKGNLTRHKKYDHLSIKAFKCDYDKCKKAFKSKDRLNTHKKKTHFSKNLKCNFCNYKTAYKTNLKEHINGKHIKEIVYICNYQDCDFKTFWPSNLKTHINAKHTNKVKYACNH